MWSLTDRLRKAREHAGLKQQELADRIGVSRGAVGNYEQGITEPKRPVLLSWALATRVPLKWLQTGQRGPDGGPGTEWYPAPWLSNVA